MRVVVLGVCVVFIAFLFWGSLGGDDGVIEVLVYRSEVLLGRFIEVFCFEDYDSYRRFEGTRCSGDFEKGSALV